MVVLSIGNQKKKKSQKISNMTTIQIENLKCGGCANTIRKGLVSIKGITSVDINIENGVVVFDSQDEITVKKAKEKLAKMGYPEVGTSNSTLQKAKSFVSCAVGRITSEE